MLNNKQLREAIIQPALRIINQYSTNAEELLVGVCAHESKGGTYLKQITGPALGIYQMEPATHSEIWNRAIRAKSDLEQRIFNFMRIQNIPNAQEMVYNLYYATIMARIFFMRFPEPISDTLEGQAQLWKDRYNTKLGKGTVEQYIADYRAFTA